MLLVSWLGWQAQLSNPAVPSNLPSTLCRTPAPHTHRSARRWNPSQPASPPAGLPSAPASRPAGLPSPPPAPRSARLPGCASSAHGSSAPHTGPAPNRSCVDTSAGVGGMIFSCRMQRASQLAAPHHTRHRLQAPRSPRPAPCHQPSSHQPSSQHPAPTSMATLRSLACSTSHSLAATCSQARKGNRQGMY